MTSFLAPKVPKPDTSGQAAQAALLKKQEASLAKQEQQQAEEERRKKASIRARGGQAGGRQSLLTGAETGVAPEKRTQIG